MEAVDEPIHKVIPPALSVPSAVLVSTHIPLFLFVVLALASSAQSEISRHQAVVCHSIVRRQRHTEARERGKLVFMSGRSWRKSTFFSDLLPVTWAISFIRHLTIEMLVCFLYPLSYKKTSSVFFIFYFTTGAFVCFISPPSYIRDVALFSSSAILQERRFSVHLPAILDRRRSPVSYTRLYYGSGLRSGPRFTNRM